MSICRKQERDFIAHKGHVARRTAKPRGGSFPGTIERPRFLKQIFARALRRANSEAGRRAAEMARQAALAAPRAGLAGTRARAHRDG